MSYQYTENVIKLINNAETNNKDSIIKAAKLFEDCIYCDKVIHAFGTGHAHMLGIELFARAGGLGNVDAMIDPDTLPLFGAQRSCAIERKEGISDLIYDNYDIEEGDIMVITSNSGRNSMPIEMAMRAKKEGTKVIAITNVDQSKNQTSRHSSGKRLFEIADVVINTGIPVGDATCNFNGSKTGPVSSIITMYLANLIVTIAVKNLADKGFKPMLFESQNIDGFTNDEIYKHYKGRIKHY